MVHTIDYLIDQIESINKKFKRKKEIGMIVYIAIEIKKMIKKSREKGEKNRFNEINRKKIKEIMQFVFSESNEEKISLVPDNSITIVNLNYVNYIKAIFYIFLFTDVNTTDRETERQIKQYLIAHNATAANKSNCSS